MCYNTVVVFMEADIKSFLAYLENEKKYSLNTLSAYKSDLEQLVAFSKSSNTLVNIDTSKSFSNELLAQYLHNLKEKKYSQATLARKVAAAKTFLKYLIDIGKLSSESAPKLASPQVNKPLPKPLSVSDVRRFLARPSKLDSADGIRDKTMLELLYATGLRASELMALNVVDVDIKNTQIRCRGGKVGQRIIPLDSLIVSILIKYLNEARPKLVNTDTEEALFLNCRGERLTRQGFWQIIQGYADDAGLSGKVTPRSLRHSFAAHKLNSGVDLQSVQELLGHTHISTTKVYQELRP